MWQCQRDVGKERMYNVGNETNLRETSCTYLPLTVPFSVLEGCNNGNRPSFSRN